jgi:hypothetical protein
MVRRNQASLEDGVSPIEPLAIGDGTGSIQMRLLQLHRRCAAAAISAVFMVLFPSVCNVGIRRSSLSLSFGLIDIKLVPLRVMGIFRPKMIRRKCLLDLPGLPTRGVQSC